MRRAELHVGDEVVGRYGARMIVVDTAAWYEPRASMGRFGSYGSGRYRPAVVGDPHNGVAVAYARSMDPDAWTPDVVQLSSLRPLDVYEVQRAAERQAAKDRDARVRDLGARRRALPADLDPTLDSRNGSLTGRVTVSLSALEHLVDVAGRVGAP